MIGFTSRRERRNALSRSRLVVSVDDEDDAADELSNNDVDDVVDKVEVDEIFDSDEERRFIIVPSFAVHLLRFADCLLIGADS